MRWRVRVGYPVAILYWVLARPTLRSIMFAIGIAAFGLAIRALAAGHLKKDRELAVTGPYAVTRNPLYLGSAFLAVAFAIAGNSYWAGGFVVIYFAVFYYFVMRNEEADLKERFGSLYEQYAERVPLFPLCHDIAVYKSVDRDSGILKLPTSRGNPFEHAFLCTRKGPPRCDFILCGDLILDRPMRIGKPAE